MALDKLKFTVRNVTSVLFGDKCVMKAENSSEVKNVYNIEPRRFRLWLYNGICRSRCRSSHRNERHNIADKIARLYCHPCGFTSVNLYNWQLSFYRFVRDENGLFFANIYTLFFFYTYTTLPKFDCFMSHHVTFELIYTFFSAEFKIQ